MSQMFDLNVNNYSLRELLDFFGLTTNDDAASVDHTCHTLKQKIKGDPKLGPVTKGKINDFLNKAVDRLSQSRHTTRELFTNASDNDKSATSDNDKNATSDKDKSATSDNGLAAAMKAAMTSAMKASAPAPGPTEFMQLKNDVEQYGDTFIITRPSTKAGIADDFRNGQSALRGAPPGIVNPMAVNTIKRALNIDTRFRSNYYTTKSTDFVFNIPLKFENVTSMSVATYELPLSYYAINQRYENNCVVFQWSDSVASIISYTKQYTLLIPDGNYKSSHQGGNSSEIENTINGILMGTDLVAETGLAFSVDKTSGRSIFACNSAVDASGNRYPVYNGAMRIVFNVKANIDRTASSSTSDASYQSDTRPIPYFFGWQLGFRGAMYEMYSDGVLQAAVSEGICQISGPTYLFLCIDDYNNNVNNYYASAFGSSTIAPNILARLNIQTLINEAGSFGVVSGESLSTSLTFSREYFGPVDIQRMRITLVDEFGRVLDLNNMDWSFALMFECVYNSSMA
jgi:hypothetical protein